jgi:drug/metabolite transporter (DMT)-like permease
MEMTPRHIGLLAIHSAVLLFGLAGLFGKLVEAPAAVIVLGRTVFAALSLGLILSLQGRVPLPKRLKEWCVFVLLGALLAAHWTAFFHSIQVSTVAVALVTFSSFPLFVTLLEPYFFKETLRVFDLFTAILIVIGLILVVPAFSLDHHITQGAIWGLFAGFSFAVLSLLNRTLAQDYPPIVVAWYQNLFAALFLLPLAAGRTVALTATDVALLIALGVFCTALAHALFIAGLKSIKAQLASIITALEAVYGVVFALLLLGEVPQTRTLLGGGVILVTTVLATAYRKP